MTAKKPPCYGFARICLRFEIIISVTERILAAPQTILSGTERSLSVTERIVAVTSMIICGMEKTVSPADFIPDAMEMMFVKSSGIADETEIITVEASINLSGLEMIEAISRSIDSLLCGGCFHDGPIWHVGFRC